MQEQLKNAHEIEEPNSEALQRLQQVTYLASQNSVFRPFLCP